MNSLPKRPASLASTQLKQSRELAMMKTDIAAAVAAAATPTAVLTRLKLVAHASQIRHKIAAGRSN